MFINYENYDLIDIVDEQDEEVLAHMGLFEKFASFDKVEKEFSIDQDIDFV